MSNRRVDDELYGRPNRSGVAVAFGLMAIALIIGLVVLNKVDDPDVGTVVSPTEAAPTTEAAADDTGVDAPTTTLAVQRDPALVKVIVTNGSGVNKAAARVSDFVSSARYNMQTPMTATASNLADAVFYKEGFQAEAEAIAQLLGPVETLQADATTIASALPLVGPLPATSTIKLTAGAAAPEFDIQVMVGPGLAKKYKTAAATSPAAATPTTAAAPA